MPSKTNTPGSGPEHGSDPATGDQPAPAAPQSAEALTQAAVAGRTPPVGVALALETLRGRFDETAHQLWETSGPRKSNIDAVSAVMVEFQDGRHIVIALGMSSGAFKLFTEVPGKSIEAQISMLDSLHDPDLHN